MWIEKRSVHGKVRYCFIERYKSSLTGRYRRVSVTYGKKTPQVVKAATMELDKKIQDALIQEGSSIQTVTVQELALRFLEQYKKRVRPSTYQNGKLFIDEFVNAVGQNTLTTKVTSTWLNRFFDKQLYRNERPLTNATVHAKKAKLFIMFEFAKTHGYVKSNPVKEVKVEWKNEHYRYQNKIENKYLTLEEYHKIIDDCIDRNLPYYADAFKLQFLTGLRFGELSALQVKNIIHEHGKTYLDINSTMLFLRKPPRHYISDETKTFAGMRKVVLSKEATEIVERRAKGKDPDALHFAINSTATHYEDQRPLNINNANTQLKRIALRQGIDKPITTHYFRHTHVSVLADMGVPLRVIQKRVGHADSDITQKIYLHVTKQTEDKFEEQIDELDGY